MRGEYCASSGKSPLRMELPPRARRIHARAGAILNAKGTTSACAENTPPHRAIAMDRRNYLRVRGEYNTRVWRPGQMPELPPRARRIRGVDRWEGGVFGTTSACAENTGRRKRSSRRNRNYLRVRGEYAFKQPWILRLAGTTSACAENTGYRPARRHEQRNYLRVRGEYPK